LKIPSGRLRLARGCAPPSGGLRLVRGGALPSSGLRPTRGPAPPRAGSASLEGPPRPRPGSASLEGAPLACACSRTRAFNALTPAGQRHHAPGARAPVPPHQLPPPRSPPSRQDSARSPDRASPALCGATSAYNASVNTTMRRVPPGRHVFIARDPGASALTSRPWAPSTRCRPPTATGTQNGTSPACRTQSCSGVSLTPRTTGSAVPTTPATGATTPRGSATPSSPTTQPMPLARWAPETGRSRLPQGSPHA
jgi:hypothetical protein